MMKEIKLTQGKTALVDDEDYEYLNQWKWYAHKRHKNYYAGRNITINGKQKQLQMHRIILNLLPDEYTDHIDHNGLNNQKSNLRKCTIKDNNKNRKSYGKSKYLGVFFNKTTICAKLNHNKKDYYLGSFNSEEDAARAYDIKAKELYGQFANLNFK